MEIPPGLRLEDYDYDLPAERIAQRPAEPRDAARLLVLDRRCSTLQHRIFREIGHFLRPGDVLVLNDTRVLPARLRGVRFTGGKVEALFVGELEPGQWEVMLRAGGNPRPGEVIELAEGRLPIRLLTRTGAGWRVSVPRRADVRAVLAEHGEAPLPPYIRPAPGEEPFHRERYQTVYAREEGAVAAPTAGLHFTPELLDALRAQGVRVATLTLHVGPGTFVPVREHDVRRHRMHAEFYRIPPETADLLRAARSGGGRIVAVGTTACRVLESCGDPPTAHEGWTDLFILPGHPFRHTDALITNFHLPRTTLLMLVAAFAGRERILAAYREAVREGYRFFSYGDAMLIQ